MVARLQWATPAGLAAMTMMLGACANPPPVTERLVVIRYSAGRPMTGVLIGSPGDRYYNPLTRGWERPPPYGPVNAFTPGER